MAALTIAAASLFTGLALSTAATVPTLAAAAGRSATLSPASPTASWSESAPLNGSSLFVSGSTCDSPTHPCDDFTLNVNRGSDARTELRISLAPSAGSRVGIVVIPPGCTEGPFGAPCEQAFGHEARVFGIVDGSYVIRVLCQACAATTYKADAELRPFVDNVPAAGDQSFDWAVQQMPGRADGSTRYGEPGISINKLGHVIVNTFGPTVWISTDDGKTWGPPLDSVDPTPCRQLSGDADAVAANDDTYYADNLCLAGPTNLSYSSHDTGKTWNASKAGLPTEPGAATDSDRQWYALDPTNPAVVYLSYHDLGGPNIWVLKSTDHGETWTQQVPITVASQNFVDTGASNTSSRPLVDPTDPKTVIVFYTSADAVTSLTTPPNSPDFPLNRVYMARSTDGGLTWTNSLIYDSGSTNGTPNSLAHLFAAGAIDAAGNAYAAVAERKGTDTQTHIELLRVPKGSTAQATPVRVDQGGLGANVMPWVAAGDTGHVAVSWYGSTSTNNDDPESQWSEMFAMTTDALAATPIFTQSRVSGPTAIHAADVCLAGIDCELTGGNRNLADFQMIDIDPCGYAQMVWTDDAHSANVTMHARQTAGPSLRPSSACATTGVVPAGGAGSAPVGGSTKGRTGVLPATGERWMWGALVIATLLGVAGLALRRRHGLGQHSV